MQTQPRAARKAKHLSARDKVSQVKIVRAFSRVRASS
jgi:hypothetical protein